MLDFQYPQLLNLFPEHRAANRSNSASFLIWYLEHYYRLDPDEAVEFVCDNRGDRGIDGVFVNDSNLTITVFQSSIAQNSQSTVGDKPLREFAGTLSQFKNAPSVHGLINAAGRADVASLLKRLEIATKVDAYEVKGEYLSNVEIDANGTSFLADTPQIAFIGRQLLHDTWISDKRDIPPQGKASLDISGFKITEYIVDADRRAVIAPVAVTDLVKLNGISDQSIFAPNVRGPLGKTQVNKDIVESIKDPEKHKLFPLFHNGITIIARDLEPSEDSITIEDYFVVNGCQSLTAFYDHRDELTDELRVLVKVLSIDPRSPLAEQVTRFSNNQNGVKPRDFVANKPLQIRLQNELHKQYPRQYAFEIKRGESLPEGEVITNDVAGLYLMAFDLEEPWATHRRYQVFDDKYADIWGRPEVTAHRIVLCKVIVEAIELALPEIKNESMARYVLLKYMVLFLIKRIISESDLSEEILRKPEGFVLDEQKRDRFRSCMKRLAQDVVIEINTETKDAGDDFDYRGKLRDADWVKHIEKGATAFYQKAVNHGMARTLKTEWEASQ